MSKKLVALSALCAMGAADIQSAKVTGFYVGIGAGFSVSRFKTHNKTGYTPGSDTVTVKNGEVAEYNAAGYTVDYEGEDFNLTLTSGKNIMADGDGAVIVKGLGNIRPTMKFFLGYNYQIGQNFMAGLELSGTMNFKHQEQTKDFQLNKVNQYKNSGGMDKETGKGGGATLILEDQGTDPFYALNRTGKLTAKWSPKFMGDISLRLGYVIPTADGHAVIALRGGFGFVRHELAVSTKGAGTYYGEAIAQMYNALFKGYEKSAFEAIVKKHNYRDNGYNKADLVSAGGTYDTDTAKLFGAYVGYMKARNAWYFCFAPDSKLDTALLNVTAPITGATDDAYSKTHEKFEQADQESYDTLDTVFHALYYLKTTSHGLCDPYKKKAEALDAEATAKKTTWTWHVGVEGEYYWSNGVFVRAGYTFRYLNGVTVERTANLTSGCRADVGKLFTDGSYDGFYKNVVMTAGHSEDADPKKTVNPMWTKDAIDSVVNYVKTKVGEYVVLPDKALNGGSLKFSHEVKNFCVHEVSFGIGFKFF